MKRYALLSAILVWMFLLPVAARADGLTIVGQFVGSDNTMTLYIVTYAEGDKTIGLVSISKKVSVTFSKGEWQSFVDLWQKSRQTNSTSFQFTGSYKETETDYNSLLMMAAGPGVLFVINDAKGTYVFVLPPSQYAAFDATVDKVAQTLSASAK